MASKSGGKILVFVYGTLKRNQPNGHFLSKPELGRANFLANGYTKELFPLIISSLFNLPFLLDKEGIGKQIEGEVHSVDADMLAWLDDFEDHPEVYTRREIPVILDSQSQAGNVVQCWAYMLRKFPQQLPHCKPHIQNFNHNKHAQDYSLEDDDIDEFNVYDTLIKEVALATDDKS